MSKGLDAAEIHAALRGTFGRSMKVLPSVGSTNDVALDWAGEGAPHGAAVVTDDQTGGRGRWGRTWVAPPGRSLALSVILRPVDTNAGVLTTAVGVAIADALENRMAIDVQLRWPNDVLVGGRKVAGILVESRARGGRVDALVAGIGVNVSTRSDDLPDELRATATSLAEVADRVPPSEELVATILLELETRYDEITEGGADTVIAAATARSAVLGRRVVARLPSGDVLDGTARRLLSSGALEIATADGVRALDSGEVVRIEA